jgi:hypothetical protein
MPFRDLPRDPMVQRAEIGLHRRRLESNAQRLPMQAMIVEIHQHQPTREQAVEQKTPSAGRGEVCIAIKQHEFVRLRPQHCDAADSE